MSTVVNQKDSLMTAELLLPMLLLVSTCVPGTNTAEASMSHNSSSSVQVTNNFAYAAYITINHMYGTSPAESHTWKNVMPGTTTDPDMTVSYNLGGFVLGHDKWYAEVEVLGGPHKGRYISDTDACTLHAADVGKILTFSVSENHFTVAASRNHASPHWLVHP